MTIQTLTMKVISEQTAKIVYRKVLTKARVAAQRSGAVKKKTGWRTPKVVAKNMVLQGLYRRLKYFGSSDCCNENTYRDKLTELKSI